MAQPVSFQLQPVDPKQELHRRLEAAPKQHAEALLVAYDLLEEAHRQGILDMLHGAVGAKAKIVGELAKYGSKDTSINLIRNFLILAMTAGSLKPDALSHVSQETIASIQVRKASKPPSLFKLLGALLRPQTRRGLAITMDLVGLLGEGSAAKTPHSS